MRHIECREVSDDEGEASELSAMRLQRDKIGALVRIQINPGDVIGD